MVVSNGVFTDGVVSAGVGDSVGDSVGVGVSQVGVVVSIEVVSEGVGDSV